MRRYRRALQAAISAETKAYGFALVIWGTATLTEAERGAPGRVGVVAFIGGALGGMAAVILASFGGPSSTWRRRGLRRYAFGAVHVGSVAAALAVGWAAAAAISAKTFAYLASAASAVLTYQLVLGAEVAVSTADDQDEDQEQDQEQAQVMTADRHGRH